MATLQKLINMKKYEKKRFINKDYCEVCVQFKAVKYKVFLPFG